MPNQAWRSLGNRWYLCPNGHRARLKEGYTVVICNYCKPALEHYPFEQPTSKTNNKALLKQGKEPKLLTVETQPIANDTAKTGWVEPVYNKPDEEEPEIPITLPSIAAVDEELVKKEQEYREKYPQMFNHPNARSDEVWLGDQVIDVVHMNVGIYRQEGMPSARVGTQPVRGKVHVTSGGKPLDLEVDFYSVFVNFHELILANEKHKSKTSAA